MVFFCGSLVIIRKIGIDARKSALNIMRSIFFLIKKLLYIIFADSKKNMFSFNINKILKKNSQSTLCFFIIKYLNREMNDIAREKLTTLVINNTYTHIQTKTFSNFKKNFTQTKNQDL